MSAGAASAAAAGDGGCRINSDDVFTHSFIHSFIHSATLGWTSRRSRRSINGDLSSLARPL